jgi:UbiD family decarboxylase
MRDYIARLLARDEMRIIDRQVDPRFELAAVVAKSQKESAQPLLFRNVKDCDFPVVSNLYGSDSRLREMIGARDGSFAHQWGQTVDRAMLLGDDYAQVISPPEDLEFGTLADLPHIHWREKDAGPYITAGVVIAKDPDTGVPNLSFSRGMIVADRELRCCIDAVQDLGKYQAKAEAKNEALEIAWLIGAPPPVFLAACTSIPIDQDELKIAAELSGGTLKMHCSQHLSFDIPAHTEIVIEARILPNERRREAPFGEFMGYYCEENKGFVADILQVSWRPDAYFHGLLTGSREDLTVIHSTYATRAYRNLAAELPGIIDVTCHTSLHCTVVKIDKQYEGHAQQAILKVFATNPYYNFACMVVDSDIDIHDLNEVWWAFLTRGRIDERTMVINDIPGGYEYNPDNLHRGRIGIDATAPYGRLQEFERTTTPGEAAIDLSHYLSR